MNETLYLCVDAGTTRFKAALITAGGRLVAQADARYRGCGAALQDTHPAEPARIRRAQGGSVYTDPVQTDPARVHEYDPDDFVRAFRETVRTLLANHSTTLSGIGITGHGPTLLPVDRQGKPLYAAIGYLDDRVRRFVRQLAARESDRITSTMYLPIALFFKEELPDIYRNTRHFMQSFDYLAFLITGSAAASSATAGLKPWEQGALRRAGLDRNLFPPIRYMGQMIGTTGAGADQFGIPRGLPVAAVGVDFAASLVGTGSVRKGRACERAGSSGGINVCWDQGIADRRLLCYRHFVDGMWNVAGITSTYGKALDWARELAGTPDGQRSDAGGRVGRRDSVDEAERGVAGRMNHGDASLTLHPDFPAPAVFLPYLKGERSPVWNPYARGMLMGRLGGPYGNRPGFLGGVYQGVAFSIRNCIEIIEEAGIRIREPVVSTGGSTGPGWFMQLKADITGKTFALPRVGDAELLGIAGVLAAGDGFFPDAAAASESMLELETTFEPDTSKKASYDRLYSLYLELQKHAVRRAEAE
jgi:xylulokinase